MIRAESNPMDSRAVQAADRLHSAAIRLLRRLRLLDKASGVGPAQLSALSVLVFGGRSMSLAQLASAEQVSAPTMSRVVAALERAGLVEVASAARDRRRLVIVPSAKGKQVMWEGRQRRVEALAAALQERPVMEQMALARAADEILHLASLIRVRPAASRQTHRST
jgi:DNA-binding MarR family transcriptional regulator